MSSQEDKQSEHSFSLVDDQSFAEEAMFERQQQQQLHDFELECNRSDSDQVGAQAQAQQQPEILSEMNKLFAQLSSQHRREFIASVIPTGQADYPSTASRLSEERYYDLTEQVAQDLPTAQTAKQAIQLIEERQEFEAHPEIQMSRRQHVPAVRPSIAQPVQDKNTTDLQSMISQLVQNEVRKAAQAHSIAMPLDDPLMDLNDDRQPNDSGARMNHTARDDTFSVTSSAAVFEKDPVKKWVLKLTKAKTDGQMILDKHSNDLKVLELSKDTLTDIRRRYEEIIPTLPYMNPQMEDELIDLADSIEQLQLNTVIQISRLTRMAENLRNAPRAVLPQFHGDPLEFNSFIQEIDKAVEYMEDDQKKTCMRKALTGDKKQEMLEQISNSVSYNEMRRALFLKYGCFDSLLPCQIEKLRNLPQVGDYAFSSENSNISKMLSFLRWLKSHRKLEIFSMDLIYICRTKLRPYSQELLYNNNRCNNVHEFKVFLEKQQQNNFERENFTFRSEKKPPVKPPATSTRTASVSKPVTKSPRCQLCKAEGHYTNNCNKLQSVSGTEGVISLLKSSKICISCLQPYTHDHKEKCKTQVFSRRLKQNINIVCGCGSSLNKRVCPCKNSADSSSVDTSPRIQEITPSAPPLPTSVPMPPAIGGKTAINVNVLHSGIMINGTPLGSSQTASQIIELVSPLGMTISILCIWDGGADNTVISCDLDQFFHDSQPVQYTFQQCTTTDLVTGYIATVAIRTKNGDLFNIQALTQKLSTNFIYTKEIEIPHEWQHSYNLPSSVFSPAGQCVLIIGRDLNRLMPVELARHNNVSLYQSSINNELIVAGSNSTTSISNFISIRRATFSPADQNWLNMMSPQESLPRVCPDCKNHNCNACKNYLLKSPKVRWEEETLTSCLEFVENPQPDGTLGFWRVQGKYNANLENVPPWLEETDRFQIKLENGKLKQNPDLNEEFNAAMMKRIKSGNFKFLDEILKEHPDFLKHQQVFSPVNYAIKESSTTTKVRPVINSSFSPNRRSPALNEAQFVGSSLNKNIQDIILKMRQYQFLGQSDIDNFYQTLHLSVKDMALNLMRFRENGWNKPGEIKTLVSVKLNYGQTHSQFLANKAKHLSSEKYILPHSVRGHMFVEDSLTDDLFTGDFNENEVRSLSNVVTEGLLKAGFKLKPWVYSGVDKEVTVGKPDIQGCLGLKWSCKPDTWHIPANFNLAPKRRGARDKEFHIDSLSTAKHLIKTHGMTKRVALRIAHCVYDPICLFIQVKVIMSLLYRKLITCCPNLEWEDPVPEQLHNEWLQAIKIALECTEVSVPRFALRNCVNLQAELGIFCDGSGTASSARLFLRYMTTSGTIDCSYLIGSTKLAPVGCETAPKTECDGALQGLRLAELSITTLTDITITAVYLFSDSTITLGGICGLTCTQKLYYSQRNFESQAIISKLNVQLFHTNSSNQDADIGSKLELSKNFALDDSYWRSIWFFKQQEDWPVTPYTFKPDDVSSIQNPKMTILSMNFSVSVIETLINRFRSFRKVVSCLGYLFCWLQDYQTYADACTRAKYFVLKLLTVSKAEISGIARQFMVSKEDGLNYVLPRNFMMNGKVVSEKLILVSINEKIGSLILNDCHVHCSSIGYEIAKMYSQGYYVTRNRHYLKKLQKTCSTCCRIRKQASMSLMGPNHQLQAAKNVPAFSITFMDVLGYFKVKKSRNVIGKLFILVITCVWTRYSVFIPLENMETNSILMGIKQASYQLAAATPTLIYCDSATNFLPIQQLDGDDNNDPGDTKKLITELKKVLHSQRITLKASTPRSSWRNSIAESMVRVFKLAMKKSGLDQKSFSLAQWQYVISKLQFLVNSRPLNAKYMEDNLCVLTPSHLVFGSRKGLFPRDMEVLEDDNRLFNKLSRLDKEIQAFEDVWFASYSNELRKWTKFKHKSRALEVGDAVLMLDRINKETKQPTLAIIKEVLSNRTYMVEYQKKSMKIDPVTYQVTKSAKRYTVSRPAQQLCYITSQFSNDEIQVDPFLLNEPEDSDEMGPEPNEYDEEPEVSLPEDDPVDIPQVNEPPRNSVEVQVQSDAPLMSDLPKKRGRKPKK